MQKEAVVFSEFVTRPRRKTWSLEQLSSFNVVSDSRRIKDRSATGHLKW